MRKLSGFTVVELVIVVAIVAVMARFAIQSFSSATDKKRLAGEVDSFVGDMQYARAEAMREGTPVTVCPSSTGTSCSSPTTSWQSGWLVFSDVNGTATVDSNDILLKWRRGFTNSDTFTATSNATFTYNRLGMRQGGNPSAADIKITAVGPTTTTANRQCVFITYLGRLTATSGSGCS